MFNLVNTQNIYKLQGCFLESVHDLFVDAKKMRFCKEKYSGGQGDAKASSRPKNIFPRKVSLFGAVQKIMNRLLGQQCHFSLPE
jgi:hypothetical protein